MAEKSLNQYQLSRNFWDFCFENTGKIKPVHISIYFFALEHCNRLGWKKSFGLPTSMVLDAINVKSYSVYKKAFDELVEFGFIEVVEYSRNQYSSNIIALKENYKANYKALDKAIVKHVTKHTPKHFQSTCESTDSIDKPITNNQEQITNNREDEEKKVDSYLIPTMCQVWYSKFTHYTKNQQNDFPAMRKILQFMTSQAGQTNINDPTVKETILNTLEQIANEVAKDSFWLNKPINSIANNIQEFYNKIKNPQNGSHKQPPSSKQAANQQSLGILLESIGNDMERIRNEDNRA